MRTEMEEQSTSQQEINFKFKELKVYSSTEWLADNKKKYRQVFDRFETSYLYAELSFYNKLFDRDNWECEVELRCFEIKTTRKQICALHFRKKISKFDQVVFIREGWGNKKEGSFWKKGTYYWEAWIEGEKVSTKYFYVEDPGDAGYKNGLNPYNSVYSIRMYEGQYDDVIEGERKYLTAFSAEESRYIYAEIFLRNKLVLDSWHCELFVKFYNEARELKGQVTRLHNVRKDEDMIRITAGWGANTKGSWKPGTYSVEVIFMDQLLATASFVVGDTFIEGYAPVQLPDKTVLTPEIQEEGGSSFVELYEKLNQLTGLQDVKQRILEHARYIEFLKLRKEKGFREQETFHTHAVFMGNPGTGKTTIARMLGMLYRKMGLLSKGQMVEVDRADLVGEYIGQTAPKTREVIEKARGGILFIDEAYALARTNDDSKDFGREVIEILIKEMSNGKGDLAVVVAGYPREMKHFIQSNPGLRSRFKQFYEFQDYVPQELIMIAEELAAERQLNFTPEGMQVLKEIITEAYRERDRSFGNARFIHDTLDKIKTNMAMRIMSRKNPFKLSKAELSEVTVSDVMAVKPARQLLVPDIPVDEVLLREVLSELNVLSGIDHIKAQIHEMVSLIRYYKATGKNVLETMSLHTVLIGNPGTGKTTVARMLARIYKALGILERGHIIETDRQGLVAGFVGQTAIKTAEKIDEAQGGVLFIDEAYALSNFNGLQGDFGHEAIQTLLKKMEDLRGKFFVIVAGYPDNMETFLKANPGLNSRFDKTYEFDDYSPEVLMQIALQMADSEGYGFSQAASPLLQDILLDSYNKRDKFFGNARTVRKIIQEIIKNQNLRVSSEGTVTRRKNQQAAILPEDISPLKDFNERGKISRKSIGFRSSDS